LLKFSFDLLEIGWNILGAMRFLSRTGGKQIAAEDPDDGHFYTSSKI
jgi:hypothetical protein